LSLIRWDPFDELAGIRAAMNRVFDETFAKRGMGRFESGRGWHPSVDMYETDDNVVVRADLPGVDQKDVEVILTDNSLTVKGESKCEKEIEDKNVYRRERSYGQFARTLPITTKVKADLARAEFKNGVLEVIIPKAPEAREKTYRLDIH
jgi:HSP20 family protein